MSAPAPIDGRIVRFLQKHHVLTLATTGAEGPHCSNLFYAWCEPEAAFVFASAADTLHAAQAVADPRVAGSVVLETRAVGKVQGVQFNGRAYAPQGEVLAAARSRYLRRFPYAAAMSLDLWLLEVDRLKFTDNTLGFGTKLLWERTHDRL